MSCNKLKQFVQFMTLVLVIDLPLREMAPIRFPLSNLCRQVEGAGVVILIAFRVKNPMINLTYQYKPPHWKHTIPDTDQAMAMSNIPSPWPLPPRSNRSDNIAGT